MCLSGREVHHTVFLIVPLNQRSNTDFRVTHAHTRKKNCFPPSEIRVNDSAGGKMHLDCETKMQHQHFSLSFCCTVMECRKSSGWMTECSKLQCVSIKIKQTFVSLRLHTIYCDIYSVYSYWHETHLAMCVCVWVFHLGSISGVSMCGISGQVLVCLLWFWCLKGFWCIFFRKVTGPKPITQIWRDLNQHRTADNNVEAAEWACESYTLIIPHNILQL